MKKSEPKDIDEYIESFADDVQKILNKIRSTIQKAAPEADEAISYQMPTFKLNGKNLIHFAALKNHIGLYSAPRERTNSRMTLLPTRAGKVHCNFHWISRFHTT